MEKRWIGWLMLGGLVLAIFFAASSFLSVNQNTDRKNISEILTQPDRYYNRDISATARIHELVGGRAFTVSDDRFLGQDLLVISKEELQPIGGAGFSDYLFEENDLVRIDGRVRQFNRFEIERELGIDLDDERYMQWEGKPVLVADDVAREQ